MQLRRTVDIRGVLSVTFGRNDPAAKFSFRRSAPDRKNDLLLRTDCSAKVSIKSNRTLALDRWCEMVTHEINGHSFFISAGLRLKHAKRLHDDCGINEYPSSYLIFMAIRGVNRLVSHYRVGLFNSLFNRSNGSPC